MHDENKYDELSLSDLFVIMKRHLDRIKDAPEAEHSIKLDYVYPRTLTREAAVFLIRNAVSLIENILDLANNCQPAR